MSCSGLDALPRSIADETAINVNRASLAAGVEIAAVSATYNMTDPDVTRREAGRFSFAAIAGAAGSMGTQLVTVCTGSKNSHNQWQFHPANDEAASWTEMCREIEFALFQAEQHGLLIGVEPEPANVVSSPLKAARLLEEFPGSRLRIVFDPANILEGVPANCQDQVIDEAFDLMGPSIALAHAKDRFPDGRIAPAGLGVVDWGYVLEGLSRVGFDGHLIAHGISESDAPLVAGYLRQKLTIMGE
jgi:sugar phosphate isomerase/epimerase